MGTCIRRGTLLLGVAAGTLFAAAAAAQINPPAEPIKDRAGFIPNRKHQPVKGKAVGVLLYDGQPVLSAEGRSGPADQLVFGANGASYRWVYVETPDAPQPVITNLQVPVGDQGEKLVFPKLDIARPHNVKRWNVTAKYTLVELEVNKGQGSPANDSFVATNIRVLNGTADFPLNTETVIADLKKRYARYQTDRGDAIERAMDDARQKAIKDKKATGPRDKSELMFVTWLPETQRLRVHFRTKLSDGAFEVIQGGGGGKGGLKLPPQKGAAAPAQGPAKQPPPPLKGFMNKVGTAFGLEYGQAYEVDRTGKLVRTQELPFQAFQENVNEVIGGGDRDRMPLPLPPKK